LMEPSAPNFQQTFLKKKETRKSLFFFVPFRQ
jgi:hypothetical protein